MFGVSNSNLYSFDSSLSFNKPIESDERLTLIIFTFFYAHVFRFHYSRSLEIVLYEYSIF